MLLLAVVSILGQLLLFAESGYIPPGPKYKCPLLSQIWPCVCLSSNDNGVVIRCEDVSLATLSTGLSHMAQKSIPIESLHILEINSDKLFGPLFQGLNITNLTIDASPIKVITSDVFYPCRESIKDIKLIQTDLREFPNDAFYQLKNLESLTLDKHFIKNLTSQITGLDSLKALRISNGNITEISKTTFSNLPRLNRLDLHGNLLKDLPKDSLKEQKNLEFFDIAFNKFTKLDPMYFNHLTKLTWFNGSHNDINDFKRGAFARNNFLRVIYMTHNKITKLDAAAFRGMRLLRRLFLSDNQITEVGRGAFSSIGKVGTIDLSRNLLPMLDYQIFSDLQQAEILDVSGNLITEVKKEAFKDLAYVMINMSYNSIEKFDKDSFVNCINITILDLSYNYISNFTKGTFDEFSYPTDMRLEFNRLTSLGDVPLKTFHGIKILNVSNNALEEIPRNTFPKLYELHTVDLSFNNITKIHPAVFTNLFSLRYLDLSNNGLKELKASTFGTIPTLIHLKVARNMLNSVSAFSFTQLASLRSLDVSFNRIKTVFQISPSLNDLNISNNEISTLNKAWPVMNSLLRLNLNNNKLGGKLDSNSFSGLGSLQEVHLASNGIHEIPKNALSSLTIVQKIDLSHNSITILQKAALGRLPVLFTLYLSKNNISEIEEKAFDGLLQLQTIDLSQNNISSLPIGSFATLVSLRTLNLSFNSLERTDNGTQNAFEDLLSLETLLLSHNEFRAINSLTFPSKQWTPYRLSHVDLSHNKLIIITKDILKGTSKLRVLNLSSNMISEIKNGVIGNMTALTELNLSRNNLAYVDSKNIRGPNLKILDLSSNRLRKFPSDTFSTNMTLVDLRRNNFQLYNDEWVENTLNGTRVLLNENPLKCDCRLIALLRFYTEFRPKLSNFSAEFYNDFHEFQCGGKRDNVEGSYLKNFREDELSCDYANDFLAPKITDAPELEIRSLENIDETKVSLRWRVRSKGNIGGFRISVKDESGSEIWNSMVSYGKRNEILNLVPEGRVICIEGVTISIGELRRRGKKACEEILKKGYFRTAGYRNEWNSSASLIKDNGIFLKIVLTIHVVLILIKP